MKHAESKLQQSCVKWFDYQYSALKMNLFAIPNGGKRGKIEAGIMKGEGVRAGVADLFLAVSKHNDMRKFDTVVSYGLFIEMKFGSGKQTESQKLFQESVVSNGYRYEVVSDFDQFRNLINEYLN